MSTRDSASAIREKLIHDLGSIVRVGRLPDIIRGPHPEMEFIVVVSGEHFQAVRTWVEKNHDGHSVLLHPESGNDLRDHTELAQWMGKPLQLRIDVL